ncbi:trypsin-2-like [Brachyistius frenatus]|uniref:trypsin-2-like n=1 Tax=Brachyistius frenatus TaxID=100188 RepID=UPI0037E92A52
MLIKLAEPAKFDEYVRPVALPGSCAAAGTRCLVSGWGATKSPFGCLKCLHCLDLPVLSQQDCENSYPNRITSSMFCAGFLEGGKDSCHEFSRAILVCDGELQGVVSWGWGCAEENRPGVYAKVCQFTDWLRSTMGRSLRKFYLPLSTHFIEKHTVFSDQLMTSFTVCKSSFNIKISPCRTNLHSLHFLINFMHPL